MIFLLWYPPKKHWETEFSINSVTCLGFMQDGRLIAGIMSFVEASDEPLLHHI